MYVCIFASCRLQTRRRQGSQLVARLLQRRDAAASACMHKPHLFPHIGICLHPSCVPTVHPIIMAACVATATFICACCSLRPAARWQVVLPAHTWRVRCAAKAACGASFTRAFRFACATGELLSFHGGDNEAADTTRRRTVGDPIRLLHARCAWSRSHGQLRTWPASEEISSGPHGHGS